LENGVSKNFFLFRLLNDLFKKKGMKFGWDEGCASDNEEVMQVRWDETEGRRTGERRLNKGGGRERKKGEKTKGKKEKNACLRPTPIFGPHSVENR